MLNPLYTAQYPLGHPVAVDAVESDPRILGEKLRKLIRASGKTQAKIAEEIGADPTYVSQMVNGKVNWTESGYFRPLTIALGLKTAEIAELKPDLILTDDPAPFDPRTLFHPPARQERIKRPLWPNLAAMIEEKGERYPKLRQISWQQHLNQTRFSGGQEPDADGWFEMFRALERAGVEPEEWPEE